MFACQECGKKFRTVKAAERASNHGCPGCGGVDVDIDLGGASKADRKLLTKGKAAIKETAQSSGYWKEVFGEIYVAEGGAVTAKLSLQRSYPDKQYKTQFDCVQQLWRVYE